jgi:peptidoglycan/LPS O-acetylase OafA/YrhL
VDRRDAPSTVAAATGRRFGYEPQLDGLRAVAVLAVLAYHSGAGLVGGGYLGVDVFFVLSGFLITTLLLQEHDGHGRISIRAFYWRRVRRLLPALTVVVIVSAVLFGVTGSGFHDSTVQEAPAAFLYVISWLRAFGVVQGSGLSHTWSLSVEEHFYLLWPSVIVVLARGRRAVLIAGVAASALTATAYSVWMATTDVDWQRLYFAPDTRIYQILLGCLLAVLLVSHLERRPLPRWPKADAAAAGAALLLVVSFSLARASHRYNYLGFGAVLGVAAAMLIAHLVLWSDSPLAAVLRWPPVVWVGKRSYGLYLWQVPAIALTERVLELPRVVEFALGVVATFVLATASFRFVEQPVLSWRRAHRARLAV